MKNIRLLKVAFVLSVGSAFILTAAIRNASANSASLTDETGTDTGTSFNTGDCTEKIEYPRNYLISDTYHKTCYSCGEADMSTGVDVSDSDGVVIGVKYKRKRLEVQATIVECKYDKKDSSAYCTQVILNPNMSEAPDCGELFVPHPPDTTKKPE